MSLPIKFFKTPTLPASLVSDAFYAVEVPGAGNEDFAEFYVTDNAGVAHGIGTAAWVQANSTSNQVVSGAVVGTDLVLTLADSSTVTIDATAMLADVRVTGGVYNPATQAIDFTMSDGSTFTVPAAALIPVASDATLDGDGSTTPLSVALSTDANQAIVIGGDGKIYVDGSTFHTHPNKIELDKIGEDATGCMTYNGDYPDYWTTAAW